MSAKHTPGPWKADGYHVRQSGQLGSRAIADVAYTGPHHTTPDEYPKSCRIVDEANARLIAGGPELLEALQYAQALATAWVAYYTTSPAYGNGKQHCEHVKGLEKIAAAIAKATGTEVKP